MQKEKAILFWSGGKDAAMALHKVLEQDRFEVVALITTLNENFYRSSMHGIREEMMDLQANLIGIPLHKMWVSKGTNEEYEEQFTLLINEYAAKGVFNVIFGDIFLEDLKIYRDNLLRKAGAKGVYPLWKMNTLELLKEGILLGFKTIICTVNQKYLAEDVVGEILTEELISKYSNIDPCGENGEYHTFVVEAPYFSNSINYKLGEKIYKPVTLNDAEKIGFWYCDILLNYTESTLDFRKKR